MWDSVHNWVSRLLLSQRQRKALKQVIDDNSAVPAELTNVQHHYFDVSTDIQSEQKVQAPVFITSRFRSGSTLLWNVFRQLNATTSFYEPFNERRWFDPHSRGVHTDNTHRGVSDYWQEFEGMEVLGSFYNEDWIRYNLLMDKHSSDINMYRYIENIIKHSPARPVLQFNRIDFRLEWLKKNFPNGKIVHLYRHPRDQWCSFLIDHELMNHDRVEENYQDAFYLDVWCKNLSRYFPFLSKDVTPHPYSRFYLLWKLSYLYGQRFADVSLSFESLVTQTGETLESMFQALNLPLDQVADLTNIISAPKLNRWTDYAPQAWFEEKEIVCEQTLTDWYRKTETN